MSKNSHLLSLLFIITSLSLPHLFAVYQQELADGTTIENGQT